MAKGKSGGGYDKAVKKDREMRNALDAALTARAKRTTKRGVPRKKK